MTTLAIADTRLEAEGVASYYESLGYTVVVASGRVSRGARILMSAGDPRVGLRVWVVAGEVAR